MFVHVDDAMPDRASLAVQVIETCLLDAGRSLCRRCT